MKRLEDASNVARELRQRLQKVGNLGPRRERHQSLVAAFIRLSELVQGIADREFHHIHADEISPTQKAGNALLLSLAQTVAASWDSGFSNTEPLPPAAFQQLYALGQAGSITTKQAEGYAFYALYPESYIAAARQSGLGTDTTVIGIRSIGAGLAALVAAGLGAPPAITIRPSGHPFDRQLVLGPKLSRHLLEREGAFAVVDEGPGLSGSSFNCVADWLVRHGIAEKRIHFFPSHFGDLGPQAQEAHRQRWAKAPKHHVSFDALVLDAAEPAQSLESWIASAVGPLTAPLRDISGGNWRDLKAPAEVPADPAMEKRKFLAETKGGKWLAKFSGNGDAGQNKLALAQALGDAGFLPQPMFLACGFLLMPWLEGQTASGQTLPPGRLIDYLAFRSNLPPQGGGASLGELFEAAIYNIGQRYGENAATSLRTALGNPERFHPIPCCTDNRIHAWEWHLKDGQWFKFDSLDHHAAHDLVGCQDIAWDLAGAAVELDLCFQDRDQLATALAERIGRSIEPDFVAASELCYLGFQIGLWSMARDRNNRQEFARIDRQLRRYGQRLLANGVQIT
ncbi:hypothetical protein [Devosia submarina]|uniref:hypothetical protein n=1 Tax=Devosia submarina TaxID=1173082 RepID=UPI000D365F57|nr:hypothetical protein [Devosia submarina]